MALTFHRFIEEDNLVLELNGNPIKAWNPFILENSATQELPEESIFSDDGSAEVVIQPYVLPHKTKFASDDDYEAAGGPKGWNYHQGIYVYRNRRLIIYGTWFDYIKKEPAYNLARIKIDITNLWNGKLIFVQKFQPVYIIPGAAMLSPMLMRLTWIMYGNSEKRMADTLSILTENTRC